jgi:hypothetical protein
MVLRDDPTPQRYRWFAFAAVLAGIFLALFGVGSGLWWTSVLGVALLAAALGLAVTAYVVERDRVLAVGQAYVVEASEPPASGLLGRCEMTVSVEAPGLRPTSVLVRDPRVPVEKWPVEGTMLPVRVAPGNPRRLQVLWDRATASRSPQRGAW